MSKSGDSLDSTRERDRQRELQDTRQFVEESRSTARAEKHCVVREIVLEPLPHVSELEVTPDIAYSDDSVRTITPPYLRRFALPQGTLIDRNVTRGRGTAAASERFLENVTTDPTKKALEDQEGEGYDPSFTHSPLRPGDESPVTVEGSTEVPPGDSEVEGATGVSSTVPPFLPSGLFEPLKIPHVSSDQSLPLIPWRRSKPDLATDLATAARLRRKTAGDRTETEKTEKPVPWKYSARNFPSAYPAGIVSSVQVSGIHPLGPSVSVTESGSVKTATTDVIQTPITVTTPYRQKDAQSDITTPSSTVDSPDKGEGLPEFLTRPSPFPTRPPSSRESSPEPIEQPPVPVTSVPLLPKSLEAEGLEFLEEEFPSQYSESSDVGKVIDQLAKLTLEGRKKAEPEDQGELIEQTLEETRTIERLIFELSELCRRESEGDESRDQEQSTAEESQVDAGESSETSLKKPVSRQRELETLQIPHTERVLLLKLQDTNQKLCRVTQSWKESNRQVAYLNNQNKKLVTEIENKDKYFDEISHKNILEFERHEQELRKANLVQFHKLNTLEVEKARAKQAFDKVNEEKVHLSDLARDLQQKLDKVLSTKDKEVRDLHKVIEEQEEKLADHQRLRESLHIELGEVLDKQIQLNDQLMVVTAERESLKQELETLNANLGIDSHGPKLPSAIIRRRLSSTVNPQADHDIGLSGPVTNGWSPIVSDSTAKGARKVGFSDSPDDIIDSLRLGLGEVILDDIWDTTSVSKKATVTKKSAAEKPYEDLEVPVFQKTVVDPFQDYQLPGQLTHWDVFDPSQVVISETDGANVAQGSDQQGDSDQPEVVESDRRVGSLYREHLLETTQGASAHFLHSTRPEDEDPENPPEDANMPGRLDLMTKLTKPEPFFGKEYESGREWLRRFDSYCISGGFDPHRINPGTDVDSVFRAGMISLLNGAAAVWLDSLPPENRNSYRTLREAFEKRWVLPYLTGTRLSEETRLASRVMTDNDTVESIYQELAAQCHKMGKGERDLMIHFVRSLRPDIQDRVVTGCPKDMMSAYQMAQAAEARLRVYPSAPSLTALVEQNPHLAAIQKDISDLKTRQEELKQDRNRPVCGYCQKYGHSQADCRTYKRDREQMNQKPVQQKQKPQQSSKSFDGICFHCGQKGHMRRDCPNPRKSGGNKDQSKTIEDLKKRLKELESKQKQSEDPK